MISKRARVVRKLFKLTKNDRGYQLARIHKHRQRFDRNMTALFLHPGRSKTKRAKIAGVNTVMFYPPESTARTIIYLHGGGFTFGSIKTHAQHTARLAKVCAANVLAIDYSLAPENPFPLALDELQAVWNELLANGLDVSKAIIMGDSAGGNMTLAFSLRLRDTKFPQPAGLVLLSPALDATFSGTSYALKKHDDPMLSEAKLEFFLNAYKGSTSKINPLISPIFASLKDLPPILIHVGTEEILLSDSETLAKNAKRDGADLTIHIADGMWHGWHLFAAYVPEAKAALKEVAEFVAAHIE